MSSEDGAATILHVDMDASTHQLPNEMTRHYVAKQL